MAARADVAGIGVGMDREGAVTAARRFFGSLLVLFGFLVMYGIAWDSTWHGTVGRDKGFLSPPHAMMYGSAAIAGLLTIAAVLIETVRFHARTGVHDENSVRVLRLFHAPIGLLLAGFGILTMVVAGPLDNYWHTLYGIFLSAWHPFHLMGIIGGAIWGVGNLYLWSAVIAGRSRTGRPAAPDVLWAVAAAAVLLRLLMTVSYPALTVGQTISIGSVRFMTYPCLLALSTLWLLWAAQRTIPRAHGAALSVLLLLGFHGVIQLTIPWIVRTQAAVEQRAFFNPTLVPTVSLDRMLPDVGLLVIAAVLPPLLGKRSPAGVGLLLGAAYWLVGAATAAAAAQVSSRVVLPPGLFVQPQATLPDALVALPLTLLAAVLSGLLGQGLSEVLRRNRR